jgi:hypothetical protein
MTLTPRLVAGQPAVLNGAEFGRTAVQDYRAHQWESRSWRKYGTLFENSSAGCDGWAQPLPTGSHL